MRARLGGAGARPALDIPPNPEVTKSHSRGTHCAFVQRKSPTTTAAVSPARTPTAGSRVPVSSRCASRGARGACRDPEQPRAGHRRARRLPPALATGAGERSRPGPQLRRAGPFPLLQRLVPPSALPPRPQPGQPAGRRGPAVAPRVPAHQPTLLPAHSLRSGLLHGCEQHLEDRRPPLRHRLRLPGLRVISKPLHTGPLTVCGPTWNRPAGASLARSLSRKLRLRGSGPRPVSDSQPAWRVG